MRKRNLVYLLLFGNTTTKIGNIVFNILLVKWLLDKTGSAYAAGIVMAFSLLPTLVFSIFSGVLVDILSKKRILVFTDFLNALLCILMAVFTIGHEINIAWLSLVVFLIGANNSLFGPAFKSILPEVLGKDDMVKVNSQFALVGQLASVTAPLLAGLLMGVTKLSIHHIFIINGATFLVSSICEIFIPYEFRRKDTKEFRIFRNIIDGFMYVKSVPWLFTLLITAMLVNVFIAGYDLMLPFYLKEIYFDSSGEIFSIALTIEAIAGILAAALQVKFEKNINFDLWLYLFFSGLGVLIINVFSSIIISLIGVFLFNFFLVFFNVNFFARVQVKVDEKYIGRTFSIIFLMANLIMPFSKYLFGLVTIPLLSYIFIIIGFGITVVSFFQSKR